MHGSFLPEQIIVKSPLKDCVLKGSGGMTGGKSGSGAGRVAVEDPNTLRSNSIARIIDVVSSGPILGLVNDAMSIYFDNTALRGPGGDYQFQGVAWNERTGTVDQDPVTGFSSAENTQAVNVEILYTTPITRTVYGPIDAARVLLSFPALTTQDATTGDLHGGTVALRIYKRTVGAGAWTTARDVTITGKCVTTFQVGYRIELGGTSDWEIKVERLSPDSSQVNIQSHSWWAAITNITEGKFIYPNTAYNTLMVDAQQFGSSIPVRAYDTYGRIIQIPSNYNPVTRVYTGIWDGTFTTGWTDNPAWVLYDLLTSEWDGLGTYITAAQVDKWSLYTIAQYCDELVPDGFGGYEPRYTFNYQITAADDAYKVIQSVASVFRGLAYWASGSIFFAADMPSDPIKLVVPANVRNGEFTYEGIAHSARHSVAMVTWFDPDDMCRQAIELVEDPDLINELGWRPLEVVAYACTSRGQAHRLGKWALDSEKYATEIVTYEAAWDHADISPGEIILLQDPNYASIRLGGRIEAATSNSLTVDEAVTFVAGLTYSIKVVLPDGTLASRDLTNLPGVATVLTFDTVLSTLPIVGAIWIVTASNLEPRQFRVLSMKESTEGYFAITAAMHDPTKYDRVEQGIKLEAPQYTRIYNSRPSAPKSLSISERLYRYNTQVKAAATLSWEPPADTSLVQSYEVEKCRTVQNNNWETVGVTNSNSLEIPNCESGDWSFRVRSIGYNGLLSSWTTKAVTLYGLAAPPADVEDFAMHTIGNIANLQWTANTELDISHYRIKFSTATVGATWGASVDLLPQVSGVSAQVSAMVGTYLIKAVDLSGNESVNATLVVSTIAELFGFNAVEAVSDYPSWEGTHDGTEVRETTLRLATNNNITGGEAGTPGTLPDGWEGYLSEGMNRDIVGFGYENGIYYVEIRFYGTPTGYDGCSVEFPIQAVETGDTWTQSVYVRIIDGTMDNIDWAHLGFFVLDSSYTWPPLEWPAGDPIDMYESSLGANQRIHTRTIEAAGAAWAIPLFEIIHTTGGNPIDITFRIGLPHMEEGEEATPFMVESSGTYTLTNSVDLGAVYTSRVSAAMDVSSENYLDIIANWVTLSSVLTLSGTDSATWGVQPQLRYTSDDPAGSPTWTAWQNLIVGDYTARAFEFRLLLSSTDTHVTPIVNDVTFTVDMPDRPAGDKNVSVPAEGLAVTFSPAFKDVPAVGITGQDLASGDKLVYLAGPSESGFTVQFQNSGGTGVARTMDWIAQGYGYAS